MIFGRFRKKRSRTEPDFSAESPVSLQVHSCTTVDPQAEAVSRPDNFFHQLNWPVPCQRQRVKWFPARQRLIGLVRGNRDAFVLPPAVVRKSPWRE